MNQSIESHILGKQKVINLLTDSLPIIARSQNNEIEVDPTLNPLIEMIEVKNKIDFALESIDREINKNEEELWLYRI